MKKNSLAGLAKKKPSILKETPPLAATIAPEAEAAKPVRKVAVKKVERKRPSEKTSERIQTMLTPSEAKILFEKAGNVSMSKFLRLELKKAGLI